MVLRIRSAESNTLAFVPSFCLGGRGGGADPAGCGVRGLCGISLYEGGAGEVEREAGADFAPSPRLSASLFFGLVPMAFLIMPSMTLMVFVLTCTACPVTACTLCRPWRVRSDVRKTRALGGPAVGVLVPEPDLEEEAMEFGW